VSELTVGPGIYTISWPEYGVTMVIDRLYESHHELYSEWRITLGHNIVTVRTRVGMLGPRGRNEIIRECMDSSMGPAADWGNLIREAAGLIVEAHRKGEPVVMLGDVADSGDSLDYRIRPFVPEGEAVVVYGSGGLGKSLFAQYLAVMVQEGFPDMGIEVEPGPVLILDWETSARTTSRRLRAIYSGMGIDSSPAVHYRFCHQSLQAEIEEIQRIVHDLGIQFVVVDSAGPACGGEPETAQGAIQFFTALRSLKISSLVIAHKAKASTDESGPFGSIFFFNYARQVFEIRKAQELGEDILDLAIFHRKANDTKLQRVRGMRVQFESSLGMNTVSLTAVDVEDTELVGDLPLHQRIVVLLKGGAMDVKALTEELGEHKGKPVREDTVRATINRSKDKFVRVGDAWGLAVSPDRTEESHRLPF
jgi:KaiC/GvpD/RAD55 family RecA-like ATPase